MEDDGDPLDTSGATTIGVVIAVAAAIIFAIAYF
jgi:hypothetical protein